MHQMMCSDFNPDWFVCTRKQLAGMTDPAESRIEPSAHQLRHRKFYPAPFWCTSQFPNPAGSGEHGGFNTVQDISPFPTPEGQLCQVCRTTHLR